MFRNVLEFQLECTRLAGTTGEFWGLSYLAAHTVLSFPGAGVREDVYLIWREMEEACSTLAQVQRLVALIDNGGCCLWSLG
jgi:hypothetical protein